MHAEVCTVWNGRVVIPGLGALLVDVDSPYVDQEANLSLVVWELVFAPDKGLSVLNRCFRSVYGVCVILVVVWGCTFRVSLVLLLKISVLLNVETIPTQFQEEKDDSSRRRISRRKGIKGIDGWRIIKFVSRGRARSMLAHVCMCHVCMCHVCERAGVLAPPCPCPS